MSHDTEAAYASSEVAGIIMNKQNPFFGTIGTAGSWSVSAMREGSSRWPLADGIIFAENPTADDIKMAFEYKRPNEGVHGILTALGQSFAYLEKGYAASIMVIPSEYSSHDNPGQHVRNIIDSTAPDIPISVYTYQEPDLSATRPFSGKLSCIRDISLPSCKSFDSSAGTGTGSVSTLWAHMREGMSHPDAFFRYCQAVKVVSAIGENLDNIAVPTELSNAVRRLNPSADIYKFLSNTSGDSISDKAWRFLWFNYYFWDDLMPIYSSAHPYTVNSVETKLIRDEDGNRQKLFSGRTDSIKNKLVFKLNDGTISIDEAWEEYAAKVRKDAHSYREVIDSGLYHIGFLSPNGTLTELGYKYVDACERNNDAYASIPMEIYKSSILNNGQYGALLHYIYKLSEELFSNNLYIYSTKKADGSYKFDINQYLKYLDDKLSNDLHLAQKSTLRGGVNRKPLQSELTFMKKLGFIKSTSNRASYRVGTGLIIDWPQVQKSMSYFQGL